MRILILCGLIVLMGPAWAESFRDEDDRLQLSDCASAMRWRANEPEPQAKPRDSSSLLHAALKCAQADQRAEAIALQALADGLPRDDFMFGTGGNLARVRIALALGELDRTATLLRTTSETLLENWSTVEDPMSVMHFAHALQGLNNDVAMGLREHDPVRAITHQLLAARAYDLPEVGMPSMAALYRDVALEIAIESKLPEALLAASDAILDRPADELTLRQVGGITLVAIALAEQKRGDDALALATRLKATGQTDAVKNADHVIHHIERDR